MPAAERSAKTTVKDEQNILLSEKIRKFYQITMGIYRLEIRCGLTYF
jgi:hypothetical protein